MDIWISFLLFFTCILLYHYKQSQSFHLPSNITNKIWLHSYPSFSFSWSRTWAKMIREIKMKRNYIPLNNEVLVVWFLNWYLTHQIIYCWCKHNNNRNNTKRNWIIRWILLIWRNEYNIIWIEARHSVSLRRSSPWLANLCNQCRPSPTCLP